MNLNKSMTYFLSNKIAYALIVAHVNVHNVLIATIVKYNALQLCRIYSISLLLS